eukprot:jgi/Bigna1/87228/estExt_fgenesh1_pg.C_180029
MADQNGRDKAPSPIEAKMKKRWEEFYASVDEDFNYTEYLLQQNQMLYQMLEQQETELNALRKYFQMSKEVDVAHKELKELDKRTKKGKDADAKLNQLCASLERMKVNVEETSHTSFPSRRPEEEDISTPLNLTKRLCGGADNGNVKNKGPLLLTYVPDGEPDWDRMTKAMTQKKQRWVIYNPQLNVLQQSQQMASYNPMDIKNTAREVSPNSFHKWYNNLKGLKKHYEDDLLKLDEWSQRACKAYGEEIEKNSKMDKNSIQYHKAKCALEGQWSFMVANSKQVKTRLNDAIEYCDTTMKWLAPKVKEEVIKKATTDLMDTVKREFGYAKQYKIDFTTYITHNGTKYWYQVSKNRMWKAVTLDDFRSQTYKQFWGKSPLDKEESKTDYYQKFKKELEA